MPKTLGLNSRANQDRVEVHQKLCTRPSLEMEGFSCSPPNSMTTTSVMDAYVQGHLEVAATKRRLNKNGQQS